MSESSGGRRVSGAISGFHAPGLVVVPLKLHSEFLEPNRLRRCGQHVCASFFLHLTLAKNMTILKHGPSSPLPGRTPGICGCCSSSQVTFQTRRKRDSIKDQHYTVWFVHRFFFCAVFSFFRLCFWFHRCGRELLHKVFVKILSTLRVHLTLNITTIIGRFTVILIVIFAFAILGL